MKRHVVDLLEAAKMLADQQKDEMLSYLIAMAIVEASSKPIVGAISSENAAPTLERLRA